MLHIFFKDYVKQNFSKERNFQVNLSITASNNILKLDVTAKAQSLNDQT